MKVQVLFKRIVRKVKRTGVDLLCLSKVFFSSSRLPCAEDALSNLQRMSPDVGGSCWKEKGFVENAREKLLSVIVPAYNVEKSIEACMESILTQDVSFDYEVIVVDDGSRDETLRILNAKYGAHPRVRIIHQENGGLSAARNMGISFAYGEYLSFVDSDDVLPSFALQRLMDTAIREAAMLVIGSMVKKLPDGRIVSKNVLASEKVGKASLPGFACGWVAHYSVFNHLKFPEGYWFEDSIMAQIVHPMCIDSAYTISEICYCYYVNDAGITAISRGNAKAIDSLWITMRLLDERKKFGLEYTQASYEYFLSMAALTHRRTKALGTTVSKCIFVQQRELMEKYYSEFRSTKSKKNRLIEDALRTMNFKKFVLACEQK